ncbi:MAG: tryptophan 2,3-dioxygenase [Planctomycetota bacterium]
MSFGHSDDQIRYGNYLHVPDLLQTQHPLTDEHDELQFIIVHQVYELWFRLMLHELDSVMEFLDAKGARVNDEALRESIRLLQRVVRIQDVLIQQLPVIETMRPGDFLRFRDRLKPASGFQSAQFREIEFMLGQKSQALMDRCDAEPAAMERLRRRFREPSMRDRIAATAVSRGLNISVSEPGDPAFDATVGQYVELYKDPKRDPVLLDFLEGCMDLDERLGIWRTRHFWMVERVIGGKIGTGHSATGAGYEGVRYLFQTLHKKAFPELWEARTALTI